MPQIINITGIRYGKLIAVRFLGRVNSHSMFQCLCDCGNMTIATSNNLRRNHTTSCGCTSSKKTIGDRTKSHGLKKHPLYESWLGMRNRCYWPRHNRYQYYGGKGITVCDEWKDDFIAFYKWGIANGWKRGLQIDRKENDKNYCPDNCRFSTVKQQARNRTSNVILTIDGVSRTAIEWAEIAGVNYEAMRQRVKKGISHKIAVFGR